MSISLLKNLAIASSGLLLAGCATQAEIAAFSDPTRGFAEVRDTTRETANKDSVWIQSHQEAEAAAARVNQLIHGKTINAETAVQAALLSNKGLQAAYAEIGMSAADVWQEALPANPKLTVMFSQIGIARTVESLITANIARAISYKARLSVAEAKLRKSQLQAIEATLRVASDTRVAWINSVSAWERAGHVKQAIAASDAGF